MLHCAQHVRAPSRPPRRGAVVMGRAWRYLGSMDLWMTVGCPGGWYLAGNLAWKQQDVSGQAGSPQYLQATGYLAPPPLGSRSTSTTIIITTHHSPPSNPLLSHQPSPSHHRHHPRTRPEALLSATARFDCPGRIAPHSPSL